MTRGLVASRSARWRRWWRDECGSASAELVIATPVLLLLILLVVQFALWEHASHVAQAVAQQSLAVARVQGSSVVAGQHEAQTVLSQLGRSVLAGPAVAVSRTSATTTVTVTGHATSVVGFLSLPVHAVATGITEHLRVSAP